jgi:hypothetical protein
MANQTDAALPHMRRTFRPNRDATMNRKTRATYYTAEKAAAARRNVERYAWAAKLRDDAVEEAERYLANGLDFLWESVTAQTLPRSYGVNQLLGSPITGREIDKFGNYPYRADPLNEPWKLTDPSSGYKFPTNDFAAFYKSGLDKQGVFRPELADRSLLVNTLYPEKGPDWGVDDGLGWKDEQGNLYTFVAYYNHWFVWYGAEGLVASALTAFRDAYLYTGEAKYARAGTVLLDRVADVYPDMDISAYDRSVFLNSDGRKNTGKVIGSIWETGLVKTFISAYDAFFPAMDDPETVRFLAGKAAACGMSNPKASGADIRRNIEEGIILQVYPAVKAAQICGNDGMHQSALAFAAVVYDTMPETKEWLDFVFKTGGLARNPYRVTGGNVLNSLVANVDRDGHGNEASPGYNGIWLNQHQLTADILDGYDLYPEADLYNNPKLRKMFSAFYPLTLSEAYTANIGDTAKTGNPGISVKLSDMVKAFDKFGDPIYAQMAYFLNGNSADNLHGDIFSPEPELIGERIRQAVAEYGPLNLPSVHLSGYGFAALRDGVSLYAARGEGGRQPASTDGDAHAEPWGTMRDVWLYYGRNTGHGHRDTLNLGMHAFGLDLTPDLGYPEFADIFDMHRAQWVLNTVSHNTVVVDKRKQEPQWVAVPKHFDASGTVQLVDVEAPNVYPQTEMYRRTVAMIRADEAHSYAVDFFRVKGGNDHHFSFHGAEGTVATEGLRLTNQPSGTYAGPEIEYGQQADGEEGASLAASGFHYLKNVSRDANPVSPFSADWHIRDTWNVYGNGEGAVTDVHLRLTMLSDADEAALADGVPPQNKPGNPKTLRYLIVRRSGTNLDSLFVSVIEPYKGSRFISGIESVSVTKADGGTASASEAKAVKVSLACGRTDWIVYAIDPNEQYIVDGKLSFQGFFGVYAERGGQREFVYVHDGSRFAPLGEPSAQRLGSLEGTLEDFTRTLSVHNELIVRIDADLVAAGVRLSDLAGKWIFIDNDGVRNASYPITRAEALGGGKYKLEIGDLTLIRAFADPEDFSKGYLYDVAEGARFRIPLTHMAK